jgi:acyl transferase domain-containing protein
MSESDLAGYEDAVAVIGMAGRFPGARDVEELWANLCAGKESIAFFSPHGGNGGGAIAAGRKTIGARGILEEVELFDAELFGIATREAELIDPQQRHLLECAWLALAGAGYDAESFAGTIGVFAGCGFNFYLINHLLPNPERVGAVPPAQILITNMADFLTSRIAYKLDLRGPSVTVQAACATSLTAVHLACKSLLDGDCDMALAGGVSIVLPQDMPLLYQEGGPISPDGHCRAFDAAARGTVPGNGCGVVLLKRWTDARRDGDNVRALVRGSAANNDGARKVSFTAPSPRGQTRVIQDAMALAQVEARTIEYVEAHGAGTLVGDPIEVAALTEAFATEERGFCALGSIKTNLGHLDAAAGVAGLIKAVLAVERGLIPPSLHCSQPNPKLDLARSPFFVNTELRPWRPAGWPRRAGVSAFGMGGTNAHVIVEQAPATPARESGARHHLLVLSARSAGGLAQAESELATWLDAHPDADAGDVAFTLQAGRKGWAHRAAAVVASAPQAAGALRARDSRRLARAVWDGARHPVAFLLPGQGAADWLAVGRSLYPEAGEFRREIATCSEILEPLLDERLAALMDPAQSSPERAAAALAGAGAQPLLFATQYALARLWQRWLGRPFALLGHSLGEYVAACLAGVFSLADGLRLVAERGKLIQQLPEGAMLAVSLPEAEARELAVEPLALAAVNAAERCVISGPVGAVELLRRRLASRQGASKRLDVTRAFHSSMMAPAVPALRRLLAGITLRPPTIPYLSNVTGAWISDREATDPDYWCTHLGATVLFHQALGRLLHEPRAILLEIAPRPTLSTLARRHPALTAGQLALACMEDGGQGEALAGLLTAAGRLWLAGAKIQWAALGEGDRRRLELPAPPLARRRYWIDRPRATAPAATPADDEPGQQPAERRAEPPGAETGERARPELAAAAPPEAALAPGSRIELADGIAQIIAELLGIPAERLDRQVPLRELGVDSLLLVHANDRIRAQLGAELPLARWLEGLLTVDGAAGEAAPVPSDAGATTGTKVMHEAENGPTEEVLCSATTRNRG